ncbi:hypothetical protein KFL_001040010 [Klebsormidium nitens]|uniref:Uncharacterized protein n=1 Tax=Klebsormidium nitens TaxID=105231 RepID=A0A1Y1I245_KLENI|nr:hypothetical protein KFL_001040010 [Klebsormidium nitens]|eukprot:GAQ82198.1 hypothetical protein KFL_001040010 [Klebsormidium nitens]
MSAVVAVGGAQAGGRALSHQCFPAEAESHMRAILGRKLVADPFKQQAQRPRLQRFRLQAGLGGVGRIIEQGDELGPEKVVIVRAHGKDYKFKSGEALGDILEMLDLLVRPGALVRRVDDYVPMKGEPVTAGFYDFGSRLGGTGSEEDMATIKSELAALNKGKVEDRATLKAIDERIGKMDLEGPSLTERVRHWVVLEGYFATAWGPPGVRVIGEILQQDYEYMVPYFDAMKDSLSPFVVVDRLRRTLEGELEAEAGGKCVRDELEAEGEVSKRVGDSEPRTIGWPEVDEVQWLEGEEVGWAEIEKVGFLSAVRLLHCD